MFRRIELVGQEKIAVQRQTLDSVNKTQADQDTVTRFSKTGIMGSGPLQVEKAWSDMNMPRRTLMKNCRFYFTELGWKRYGRPTVIACQQTGQEYRVIKIKEKSVDIFYRDEIQVAVRPKAANRKL